MYKEVVARGRIELPTPCFSDMGYIILKYFKARIAKYMITKKITPAEIICARLSPFGI